MMVRCSQHSERRPIQGVGVGLRAPHFSHIEQNKPDIPWFEVLIDNYMSKGGSALKHLETIRRDYAVTFHGVGMSLGSVDDLNTSYLKKLKSLIDRFDPVYVSDHLCWSSIAGQYIHDLLPLPYTEEAIRTITRHIQQAQDYLGCRILIENVSSYLTYRHSAMQECEFLREIVKHADCDILLDINNIYVSAHNHKLDPLEYLQAVPVERVREFHLAGYEDMGDHYLDTHGEKVHEPVWTLYEAALNRFGAVPTLVEWDNNIPAFEVLHAEAKRAEKYMRKVQRDAA